MKGLVLGKFYPLHLGHIGLIEFAQKQCDELIVLICASDMESIAGSTRLKWIQETFSNNPKIKPTLLNYSEQELPNTSTSSIEVSKVWATKIANTLGKIDVVFSSEIYGGYLAQFQKCESVLFEPLRTTNNISASEIRKNIFKNWNYLANSAKPYFVKKVCICGSESTGKSTLTEMLASHFQTVFVPEMARDIVDLTDECTEQLLKHIAESQAREINKKLKIANKFLFIDTDINTTRSYSKFLFSKELLTENWVEEANQFDLYLFLDADAPYIQDGTRLNKERRDELNIFHKKELTERGITFELVTGNWRQRFEKSVSIINKLLV